MSLPKPMVIQTGCLKKINEECKSSGNLNITTNNKSNINNDVTKITHMLVLPYKGETEQRIIKSINKVLKKILPQNHTECL